MNHIIYRKLNADESGRIAEIDASQYIGQIWQKSAKGMELVPLSYQSHDYPDTFAVHHQALLETFVNGGEAVGAFDAAGKLIGFLSINRPIFGKQKKYVLLDQLFITLQLRGQGVGTYLFKEGCKIARTFGADHLYICSSNAEESVAFYQALGCKEACEPLPEGMDYDVRDIPLEYKL